MTVDELRPDGRSLRASRTRAAILFAHRRLIHDGELSPTTTRIAEAAGVSPRTLFLHFADLETLFAATADAVLAEALLRAGRTDPALPLPARTQAFLTSRVEVYEFLTPFALAARLREHSSPALRERRAALTEASRANVVATFAPELEQLAMQEYDDAVAGLETCTTWSAWFHLRDELALTGPATYRVMCRNVLLLLASPR